MGTSTSLNAKTSDSVCIMYKSSDMTDAREKNLKNDGYSIENQFELIKASYENDMFLKTLMYDIIVFVLAFVGSFSLLRNVKE